MVLPIVSVAARRRAAQLAQQQQTRSMGGGPKPEWTGIDKVVRTYLPEDWQLAAAILGGYGFLAFVGSMSGGKKKKAAPKEAPVVVAAAPATTTGIPAVDTPEFADFISSEAFVKLLENEEQLSGLLAESK